MNTSYYLLHDARIYIMRECFTLLLCFLQINGSLARAAIRDLASQGLIKAVVQSRSQQIYTRATKEVEA